MFIFAKLNRFSFFRAPWVGTLFGKSFWFSFFCADSSSLLFRKDVFCLDFVFPCRKRLENDFDFRFSVQKAIYSIFQFHFLFPFPVSISNSASGSAQTRRQRKIAMGGGNFVIPVRRDVVADSAFRFQFHFRFRFQRRARTIDGGGNAKMCWSCVRPALEHFANVGKMVRIGGGGGRGGKIIVWKKLKRRGVIFPPEKNEK